MSKNFNIKIIIAVLLLSLGYWVGLAVSSADDIQEVVVIHGRDDNWGIKDLKFIKYKDKVQWGGGQIKYYGDGKNLDDLMSFQFQVVKEPISQNGRLELLYLKSTGSNKGFSIGGQDTFVTFGKTENDKDRIIDIENFQSNITEKEDYNFDDNYRIKAKVNLGYVDGKEVKEEFFLGMIVINDKTFNESSVQSNAK